MKKFSILYIPADQKEIKKLNLPHFFARFFHIILVFLLALIAILAYDYIKLINNAYENKKLSVENQQLREQIQLFQMKVNDMENDLERIFTFEKKLRILSGLNKEQLSQPFFETSKKKSPQTSYQSKLRSLFEEKLKFQEIEQNSEYQKLKQLYEKKLFAEYGISPKFQKIGSTLYQTDNIYHLAEQFTVFDFKYSRLKNISYELEQNLNELDQNLLDKQSLFNSTPILLPVNGWITSFYGPRVSPYSKQLKMHEGVDIGAPYGAPIYSPADATVIFSGTAPGFGKNIQLDHGYGLETIYAHASKVIAKKGQRVKRGDIIAEVGSTGHSTGPHVHYEVRVNGVSVDPYYFLLDQN